MNFSKKYEKYEHWEACQTIAEFSALPEWVSADRKPHLRPTEDVSATWSAMYRGTLPCKHWLRVCIVYTQFVRISAVSGDHVAKTSRDHISEHP